MRVGITRGLPIWYYHVTFCLPEYCVPKVGLQDIGKKWHSVFFPCNIYCDMGKYSGIFTKYCNFAILMWLSTSFPGALMLCNWFQCSEHKSRWALGLCIREALNPGSPGSFSSVSSSSKVVAWQASFNLANLAWCVLRCEYWTCPRCDGNAETIYCAALPQWKTEHRSSHIGIHCVDVKAFLLQAGVLIYGFDHQ